VDTQNCTQLKAPASAKFELGAWRVTNADPFSIIIHSPSIYTITSFSTTTPRNNFIPSVLYSPSPCLLTPFIGVAPSVAPGCVSRVTYTCPVVGRCSTPAWLVAAGASSPRIADTSSAANIAHPGATEALRERRGISKENRMEAVEDKEEGHSSLTHTTGCDFTFPISHVFTRNNSPVCTLCRVPYTTMERLEGQRRVHEGHDRSDFTSVGLGL
jgi:hypothetical protein